MTDLGYVLASGIARNLPRCVSETVALAAADVYTWTHPRRARAINRRLRRVWMESGRRGPRPTARETHRAFASAVRDFLATNPNEPAPRVRLDDEARAILRDARESGRSTVLVSGHFGPWEVALQWLAHELGSVDAIARAHRLPAVEQFFAARRAAFGVRTLSAGQRVSAALARLRAGGWIATLVDRAARARTRDRDSGRTWGCAPEDSAESGIVRLDPGPLLLARRASAQILAGVAWRAPDGTIEVRFHPAFSLEPGRGGIALSQAVARLQRFFDAHVRAHPTQWFEWGAGSTGVTIPDGADAARG